MGSSNTIYYVVGAVIIAHFLFGIGYLIYKINNAPSSKEKEGVE